MTKTSNKEYKEMTELNLVSMAQSDDKAIADRAFEEIHRRYNKAVAYFLLKRVGGMKGSVEDQNDLVQVVFEKAFLSIKRFKPEFKLSTWLMKIASNLATDKFRKKGLTLVSSTVQSEDGEGEESTIDYKDNGLNPEMTMEKVERNKFVNDLIESRLTGDHKMVIQLCYFEEKSYQEIADELNMPLGTVKANIFRAKQILREGLSQSLILTA